MSGVRRGLPLILLLLLLLPSCVSSSRHQAALDEANRLNRENEELRRLIAEYRVRVDEALDRLERQRGSGTPQGSAPAQAPRAAPPAAPAAPGSSAATAAPTSAPGAEIHEEDLRDRVNPVQAEVESLGEEGTVKVARRYRDLGRTREAIDAYSRLIRDFPFSKHLPEAFLARGRLRQAAGDPAGALVDFETVAEAFPDSREAREARRLAGTLRNR